MLIKFINIVLLDYLVNPISLGVQKPNGSFEHLLSIPQTYYSYYIGNPKFAITILFVYMSRYIQDRAQP